MRDEAFGDVPQEAKIQVTKWQGVSFAVGASCEDNHADDHLVPEPELRGKESGEIVRRRPTHPDGAVVDDGTGAYLGVPVQSPRRCSLMT